MEPRLPLSFPLRALAVCSALAVMVLWMGGGSAMDAVRLLSGVLAVGTNEEGLLRLLLARSVATFGLVTLALAIGLSMALAITLLASRLGAFGSRVVGWVGSALSGIPPMAWALGVVVLLIGQMHLPVETLFPYAPPAALDSWHLKVGRTIWAWLVPAVVLAIPVCGTAVFTLTHRLAALLQGPILKSLKARGLPRVSIIYRHLLPELKSQILLMVRPLAAMTLTFSIPVEEALRFDGWGAFAASALRGRLPYQIATAVYLAGFMLAAWYAVAGWRERESKKPRSLLAEPPEEAKNVKWAVVGGILALGLMIFPFLGSADDVWERSCSPALGEVFRASWVAVTASSLIVLSGPLMVLRRKWLQSTYAGTATTLAAAPLLLCWLALASVMKNDRATLLWLVMAAALPSAGSFREKFRALYARDFVTASLAMGRSPQRIWWHHLFPNLLPSVLNRLFRSVATLLLWSSLLGYYGLDVASSGPPSWGAQMRQNSEMILDNPLPVLAPAVWLALWSLSFRLLSRAFSSETPRPRSVPFVPS